MPQAVGRHSLLPHPVAARGAFQDVVEELTVEVSWSPEGRLGLTYRLTGDLHALKLPGPRASLRTDGLWRHTCFEAFVGHAAPGEYWEYNLSPSLAWAAYRFTGYREGMAPHTQGSSPALRAETGEDQLLLEAVVDLSWLASPPQGLRLGLAAVLEDRAQVMSYWALAHPAEKPDFHHADGFVLELC